MLLWAGAVAIPCHAVEEVSRAMNASGGRGASGRYVNTSVMGLGMPVGFSSGPSYINHSGFLHPVNDLSTSTQDTDEDGLTDWQEMGGSEFEPNTPSLINEADSDGDGSPDGDEALAFTNPLDAGSLFYLTAFWRQAGSQQLSWQGREGKVYQVLVATTVLDLQTNATIIAEVTAVNGAGPWQVAECNASNTTEAATAFYKVQLKP